MDFLKIQRILIKLRKHIAIKFKHKARGKTSPVSVGSRIKLHTFLVDCEDDVDDEDVTIKFLKKCVKEAAEKNCKMYPKILML